MASGQKLQFMKLVFYFTALKVAVVGEYIENSFGFKVMHLIQQTNWFLERNVATIEISNKKRQTEIEWSSYVVTKTNTKPCRDRSNDTIDERYRVQTGTNAAIESVLSLIHLKFYYGATAQSYRPWACGGNMAEWFRALVL